MIADGSGPGMPDTAEDQAESPRHRGQEAGCGSPLARVGVPISLATGCVIDAAAGGGMGKLTGEHAPLRRAHERLGRGDMLAGDAFCSSSDEGVTLAGMGVDVVMRRAANRRADSRLGTRPGREGHPVERRRRRDRPKWIGRVGFAAPPRVLPMRESRVRVGRVGFRARASVVVTSLLDAVAYARENLAGLYRRRWHVELDLRSIEIATRMDVLRCKTPEMVREEAYGHLLPYDLIRGVMAEPARRHAVEPRRLSPRGPRQALEAFRAGSAEARGRRRRGLEGGRVAGDRVSSGRRPGGPRRAARHRASAQGLSEDAGAETRRPETLAAIGLRIGVSATRLYSSFPEIVHLS